jgi:hypothetical protein
MGIAMDDPVNDKIELQAIRRKLNELRKEFERLSREDIVFRPEAYADDPSLLDADEAAILARRFALDEIEHEAESLEARIAVLEERYGVNATLN